MYSWKVWEFLKKKRRRDFKRGPWRNEGRGGRQEEELMWERGRQRGREKEKIVRGRRIQRKSVKVNGGTVLLFPLCSSPGYFHLSLFLSPALFFSWHQIEIPWWCFHLPVFSESIGIYFKPEEMLENLPCSFYPRLSVDVVSASCHYLPSFHPICTFLASFLPLFADWASNQGEQSAALHPQTDASVSLLWIWSQK